MKHSLPLLTLLAASAAFAQNAPNVAKKPALQHSVEAAYVSSSGSAVGFDGFDGFNFAAKAYVWRNVFLTVEHYTGMSDLVPPAPPVDFDITRTGYGLGATFEAGPGQLGVSYTFGQLELEAAGIPGVDGEVDQQRLNVTYSQAFANGITAGLGLTHFMNDSGLGGPVDDVTAVILSLGYDFRNGLSVFVTYSPDSTDIGIEDITENTFSVGARYSF